MPANVLYSVPEIHLTGSAYLESGNTYFLPFYQQVESTGDRLSRLLIVHCIDDANTAVRIASLDPAFCEKFYAHSEEEKEDNDAMERLLLLEEFEAIHRRETESSRPYQVIGGKMLKFMQAYDAENTRFFLLIRGFC